MRVVLNGVVADLPDDASVADAVASLGRDPSTRGVAVAVAGEVVRQADWAGTPLADGDEVEVLTAVQGGAR